MIEPMHRPNFYIFTGGPGVGKTTLLNALTQQGYQCVPEVARMIIREQKASGGNAVHTGNRIAYYHQMLTRSITDFTETDPQTIHFFDRGIPDLHSYQSQYFSSVDTSLIQTIEQYRYNHCVFLFPPWPSIYHDDEERKLPYEEAVQTYYSVKKSYALCGYQTIEVPFGTITDRMHFILSNTSPHSDHV